MSIDGTVLTISGIGIIRWRALWKKRFVSYLQALAVFGLVSTALNQDGKQLGFLNGNPAQKFNGRMIAIYIILVIALRPMVNAIQIAI